MAISIEEQQKTSRRLNVLTLIILVVAIFLIYLFFRSFSQTPALAPETTGPLAPDFAEKLKQDLKILSDPLFQSLKLPAVPSLTPQHLPVGKENPFRPQ